MKFGDWALLHKDVIRNPDGEPYLVRWRIAQTPLCAVYLHHILRSDDDRDLHDHPWPFVSLMLRGGYWEWVPDLVLPGGGPWARWIAPWSIVRHAASDQHRVQLPRGRTAWTLVFCGRRSRLWGFQTDNGWVESSRYLALKDEVAR